MLPSDAQVFSVALVLLGGRSVEKAGKRKEYEAKEDV